MKEDHKRKIAAALRGNSNSKGKKWTENRRKKFHESTLGHTVSQETRQKISNASKGKSAPWHLGNQYGKGYIPTEEHRRKIAEGRIGEMHWGWKGQNASYSSVHKWVVRNLGKPLVCEHCGKTGKSREMHWANKSHEYKRDLADWLRLCAKCHSDYDAEKYVKRSLNRKHHILQ